ncbi:hypothetical protein V6Z12_A11G223800 [Gossypium hirsutum]
MEESSSSKIPRSPQSFLAPDLENKSYLNGDAGEQADGFHKSSTRIRSFKQRLMNYFVKIELDF